MLFHMTSRTFFDKFLCLENDQDILDAQYVLVSMRVRTSGQCKNVVSAANILFPDHTILTYDINSIIFREEYFDQLDDNIALLATLVKGSVKEGYNIIFMCSHKERKLAYLELLAEYVYDNFGYPVYSYKDYIKDKCDIIKYDKDKVISICNKTLKKAKEKAYEKKVENGKVDKDYKLMKKLLKKNGLYFKGMPKDMMRDMLEDYYEDLQ